MHRRIRPPRESRLDYARRLRAHQRWVAKEREMLAAALAGRPVAVFPEDEPCEQLVLTISNVSGVVVDVRPAAVMVARVAVWARKTPVRQGRRAAGRARRSRSTSSKSSPDGSSSDGEPSPGWPQA
jgi:hypothetical protein